MLIFTDVNLKLISDISKYEFIESAKKVGISMICNSYCEATNKLLKSYNNNKQKSYIHYILDTYNLY